MRILCGLVLAALLAGCGVDGPPKPPPPKESAQPGPNTSVTISGTAQVGVVGGSG